MKVYPTIKTKPSFVAGSLAEELDTFAELYRVKLQKPMFTSDKGSMLLAYSHCGTIPPTMLEETEELRTLLGTRKKAYFLCRMEGEDLIIAGETMNDNW